MTSALRSQAAGRVMLAVFTILLVAFCGLGAAAMWSVLVAALGLAAISYARHHVPFRRAANVRDRPDPCREPAQRVAC